MLGDTPLSLYLNNADREVVESFTGELPPKTPLHSFVSRLSQLGLTAKKRCCKMSIKRSYISSPALTFAVLCIGLGCIVAAT